MNEINAHSVDKTSEQIFRPNTKSISSERVDNKMKKYPWTK